MKPILSFMIVFVFFISVSKAQEPPLQSKINVGKNIVCEIRGEEKDMLWFYYYGKLVVKDSITRQPISDISFDTHGGEFLIAVIEGEERNIVVGYAITTNKIIRSASWVDRSPKRKPLTLKSIRWDSPRSFEIDDRGGLQFEFPIDTKGWSGSGRGSGTYLWGFSYTFYY